MEICQKDVGAGMVCPLPAGHPGYCLRPDSYAAEAAVKAMVKYMNLDVIYIRQEIERVLESERKIPLDWPYREGLLDQLTELFLRLNLDAGKE